MSIHQSLAAWVGAFALVPSLLCAQEVPSSWVRYAGSFAYGDRAAQCAQQTETGWLVGSDGGEVVARPVRLGDLRNVRDPLPYAIDWHPSMLQQYSPVPTFEGQPTQVAADEDRRLVGVLETRARRRVVAVEDGWLVGLDAGEDGGSLWWFSAVPGDSYKLHDGNIGFMIRRPGSPDVLIVSGFTVFDEAAVLVAQRGDGGRWSVRQVGVTDGTVEAVNPTEGSDVLLATHNSVFRSDAHHSVERLATLDELAPSGTPASVWAAPSGDIYVGRTFFILRFRRTASGYAPEYYVPPGCVRFHEEPFDCVCEGGVPSRRHAKPPIR